MRIAGIDEAGRGCIIGPLVVAGIAIKEENLQALIQLGVKDSKLLTPQKREALIPEIISIVEKHVVLKVAPCDIDKAVECKIKNHKLNRLEAKTMAQIVTALEPDIVYVDAADILEEKFGKYIMEASSYKTEIISKHKADKTYPVVSAASIIAKVERDNCISELRNEYGDFGTGYLTDPKTQTFLIQWIKSHTDYPDIIRKSWKPAKEAKRQKGTKQQKLA